MPVIFYMDELLVFAICGAISVFLLSLELLLTATLWFTKGHSCEVDEAVTQCRLHRMVHGYKVGPMPGLVFLAILTGYLGGFGMAIQMLLMSITEGPLPPEMALILSSFLTVFMMFITVKYLGSLFGEFHITAFQYESLIGREALLMSQKIFRGISGEAKVSDSQGLVRYVEVEPYDDGDIFYGGDILILKALQGDRFLAVKKV